MSKRTELQDKIQQITAKLIELNAQFGKSNPLSKLEIDLLKKYTIDLYECVLLLTPETIKETITIASKVEEVPLQEIVREEPQVVVANIPVQPEAILPPKAETPLPPKVVEVPLHQETSIANKLHTEEIVNTTPVVKTISEEKKETSLNDIHQQPEQNDLASKLQQGPIHDLKKAISINKKFEFINQLFKGDHEAYAKSIHYINGLTNGAEAATFFNNLHKQYVWPEENKLFIEFSDLVRRRFL